MSFDHSLVWELRAVGRLPVEEFPSFIPKNIITRSLGPNPEVQIDLEGPFPVEPGDTFLLCSDGLSGQVKDDEIGKVLACLAPKEAVRSLVDLANLNGGPDNITVIVARVTGPQVAQGEAAQSSSPSDRAAPQPVHPVVWSLLGLFGLAALGFLAVGHSILAAAGLLGAVVTGVVAWIQRSAVREPPYALDARPLGRGPYASADCTPDAPFVNRLAEIVGQLRQAAANEDWTIDWHAFNSHGQQAAAAGQAGNYAEGVRAYCRAISFMMSELRKQRGRKRADLSEPDLD